MTTGFKWDLGWDLGWDGSWDSPIPINMGGKYTRPRIAISPNSARTLVSTPEVVARLRLLSIMISLSSESMNIGVDDEMADIWLPEAVVWLCWLC